MDKYRKLISAIAGISFLFTGITGLIMKFAFKSHGFNEVHVWFGVAMVVAATLHLVLNWRIFAGYFRDKRLYALAIPFLALLLVSGFMANDQKDGEHGNRANVRMGHH